MTDEIRCLAVPGDIVCLEGRRLSGKVLEWSAQPPLMQAEMGNTYYPIGPVDADLCSPAERFWSQNQVVVTKRQAFPALPSGPSDDPIRF